ncbi:conserved exported hypothetical protein [Thiomonas sp. CB3]|jgi:Tfp pilus assembly protein PilO|nr:conserved exported hypothetical protein [Thiomonas sp. CB3]
MKRLAWHVRRLGVPGLIGLVLALVAGGGFLLLQPLQRDLRQQAVRLHALKDHRRFAATPPPRANNASWVRTLPAASSIPAMMRELAALAQKQGLALDQGQYSVTPIAGTALLRWHAHIPITGSYPALRTFLAKSLQAMPALALDGFKLERQDIGAETVQAELRLSLVMRSSA